MICGENKKMDEDKKILKIQGPTMVEPPKEDRKLTKLEILKKLSPGTGLRESLNDIVNGEMGAIILINNSNAANIFEGGFKVNCKFTPKRLSELAKMDGGIILSEDFKKILYVNALFVPDRSLITNETGTRHQTAEKVAKQTNGLVIAVSERRGTITVYYGGSRYILQNTEDLLRRASETLRILEKQREVFDELLINLNVLEVTSLVSIADICSILQRLEMISKMAQIINEYIVELGREGIIVRMRMKEVTKDIDKKREEIFKDYLQKAAKARQFFDNLSFDGLLDAENIANLLFGDSSEKKIVPKGYRLLDKINLTEVELKNLIDAFKNLDGILEARDETLKKVLKNRTESFKEEFNKLREQIMLGKKI
ncbi:MAG: DNA integrity scanning diadenylate cyclase DisA [Candidatus Pacearchaeota archaeon]|jgi:diadenylate cyclase